MYFLKFPRFFEHINTSGSVYFEVFTTLAAATKKKLPKGQTTSNYAPTKSNQKDAERVKTLFSWLSVNWCLLVGA